MPFEKPLLIIPAWPLRPSIRPTRACGDAWRHERYLSSPRRRAACAVRQSPTQSRHQSARGLREGMIEDPSGLRWLPHRVPPRYEPTRRRLLSVNGAVASAFSAAEPQHLRGPQVHAALADEFCAWPRAEERRALLRMGVRLGGDPPIAITTPPNRSPLCARCAARKAASSPMPARRPMRRIWRWHSSIACRRSLAARAGPPKRRHCCGHIG